MGGVIGETLPLGLGIALNPIAIAVGILILSTAEARKNGLAFTIGWVAGLTALLLVASLLVQQRAAAAPHETRTIVSVGRIIFGVILIVASVRELRDRPPPGKSRSRRAGCACSTTWGSSARWGWACSCRWSA